jgi:hypothetical protein
MACKPYTCTPHPASLETAAKLRALRSMRAATAEGLYDAPAMWLAGSQAAGEDSAAVFLLMRQRLTPRSLAPSHKQHPVAARVEIE